MLEHIGLLQCRLPLQPVAIACKWSNTVPQGSEVTVVVEVMHVCAELADCLLRFFLPCSHIFYVHGKHWVCKSFFFLCIRVPAQQLEHFQAYSDRAHWAHIGCILALWRPFAERNVQAIEAAFVTEHYCFFFSKTW